MAAGMERSAMSRQGSRHISATPRIGFAVETVSKGSRQQNPSRSAPVTVGDRLTLECARLGNDGLGICLAAGGFVILTERALPGEVLELEVTQVAKGYAEARKLRTLSPHRDAVQPRCHHFGPCGGCTLQSLAYGKQLAEKQNQVVQVLKRVGRLGDQVEQVLLPPLGAATVPRAPVGMRDAGHVASQPRDVGPEADAVAASGCAGGLYEYRNKVQFAFSCRCWEPDPVSLSPSCGRVVDRPLVLGFLRPGSFDEVLPVVGVGGCSLVDSTMNGIAETVLHQVSQLGLLPWNHSSGAGTLVHLVIRSGAAGADASMPGAEHPSLDDKAAQPVTGTLSASTPDTSSASALQAAAGTHVPGSNPDSASCSALDREYLVVLNVTHQDTSLLGQLAEAVRAAHPQVVGVVSRTVATPTRSSTGSSRPLKGRSRGAPTAGPNKHTQYGGPKGRQQQSAGKGGEQLGGYEEEASGTGTGPLITLSGRGYLTEQLLGLSFRISPTSFFQTNTVQTEVLYRAVASAAALQLQDTLLDLYCGTGSIGLTLASRCKAVVGYEVNEAAVIDARRNAELNGVTNATFIMGNLEDGLLDPSKGPSPSAAAKGKGQGQDGQGASTGTGAANQAWLSPDVIIVDPARAGLSGAVRSYLVASSARRVVYVSCNPATQARDLGILCGTTPGPGGTSTMIASNRASDRNSSKGAAGRHEVSHGTGGGLFKLESVQCVDLFPHTDHVETVVVLTRQ